MAGDLGAFAAPIFDVGLARTPSPQGVSAALTNKDRHPSQEEVLFASAELLVVARRPCINQLRSFPFVFVTCRFLGQALEDYETTKRLEEEEVEYAISSGLSGVDGNGQVGIINRNQSDQRAK